MKSFPALCSFSRISAITALLAVFGSGTGARADAKAPLPAASTAPSATKEAPPKDSPKNDDEEPPTTIVAPSGDNDSDADAAQVSADANRCTQCQIQSDAYRKLKAEAEDATSNIQKNQDLQAKLKPDEDKSAWIKVESNLRMWDIKLESLTKNLSALEAQMKQDCQGCPKADGPKK